MLNVFYSYKVLQYGIAMLTLGYSIGPYVNSSRDEKNVTKLKSKRTKKLILSTERYTKNKENDYTYFWNKLCKNGHLVGTKSYKCAERILQ